MADFELVKPSPPDSVTGPEFGQWMKDLETWYRDVYKLAEQCQIKEIDKAMQQGWELYMVGPYVLEDQHGQHRDEHRTADDGMFHLFFFRRREQTIAIMQGGKVLHLVDEGEDFHK